MSFLYSSAIHQTAMKWLSETIPTAQLFWSNSKSSHVPSSRWHHGAFSVLSERKRAGTCHAVNANAGGSKGRKDEGGNFLAEEEEVLFVSLREVENEVKREGEFAGICAHI